MTPYREVFKDYPYAKFFKSLESGKVDFDTDTIEVGQIYIFVRKYLYSKDVSEDLIAVKTILPPQLETLFSPPYTKKDFQKRYYGTMPSGSKKKTMHSLPMDDVFFMSCVSIAANTYKDKAWGGRQAINETGKVVDNLYCQYKDFLSHGNVQYYPDFNYCEAYKISELIRKDEWWFSPNNRFNTHLILNYFAGLEKYKGSLENILSWAYIFKVPINPPIKEFMNWNSNPFT